MRLKACALQTKQIAATIHAGQIDKQGSLRVLAGRSVELEGGRFRHRQVVQTAGQPLA
jgi:hypothetical protein